MQKETDQPYSQESKQLAKSSFAAIAGVLLSRASGVIRTVVVNGSFGAGIALDAFNAAFRFPNALRDLFADGALSAAFIKVFVDAKEKGKEEEKKVISVVIGFFITVTLIIAILFAIFSFDFMHLMSSEKFKSSGGVTLASNLFKILAFYLPITMLNAVAMASLGVLGQTFRATNGSLFLSVGMILGSLVFAPAFHFINIPIIFGLAFGAMLGALFQLIYQFVPLIKLNYISLPNFNIKTWLSYVPLKNVLQLMAPRMLGQGALTIALFINTMFAIQIGTGVLTYVVTAITIIQVPIGLFGVATGFAALPVLTRAINEKEIHKFSQLLIDSLETSMGLAILTTAGFALFIVPFYQVVFQHGKIHFNDTIHNSIAVCAYSIGIVFSSGSKVLLTGFYSLNKTRQIVYNAFCYLGTSALLTFYLAPKLGILGLGISYGVSTCLDFYMNLFFLKRIVKKMDYPISVYEAGGRYFMTRLFIFTFLGFLFSLLGVESIIHFWSQFPAHFHSPLTFLTSFFVLLIGGLLYGILCFILIYFYGPQHIRKTIRTQFQKLIIKK
jgi:putative peptidoglycan lipid II flippase